MTDTATPINWDELKRQSRIAAGLTVVASALVLGSLVAGYLQTQKAQRKLAEIESQVAERQKSKQQLDQEIADLKKQSGVYHAALNGLSTQQLTQLTTKLPAIASEIPRVYIQVADTRNKSEVEAGANALRAVGFIVPAVESMDSRHSTVHTYVRAFHHDPTSAADAAKIVKTLASVGLHADIQYFDGENQPQRTYEFWLGRNP